MVLASCCLENINVSAKACFSPQSNWLASLHLLFHPFLLICVIIFFNLRSFFVHILLPQWPFHRFPPFPLLFSCQLFCKSSLSSVVFVVRLFSFRVPFPSIHCYSHWDFSLVTGWTWILIFSARRKALSSFWVFFVSQFFLLIILLEAKSKGFFPPFF